MSNTRYVETVDGKEFEYFASVEYDAMPCTNCGFAGVDHSETFPDMESETGVSC